MPMPTVEEKFGRLTEIMARLRSDDGCLWDRRQTHESLRQYLLEETHEVLEAIDQQNPGELARELGDLLLQVVFHAQIAAEAGRFGIGDVLDHINAKMIRRHPHVFGDEKTGSLAELKLRWEEIKKKEGRESPIDGVPKALPALQRAARLQHKADAPAPAWEAVDALYREVRALAVEAGADGSGISMEQLQKRLGELLFAITGACHKLAINAEDALRETCEHFQRQFRMAAARRP